MIHPMVLDVPALRASGLRARRGGREVLHGIDLMVPAGSLVGLLGPSGCGKSTLMRAIVGVQRHVSGSLVVLGAPAGSRSLRNRVGYVTQSSGVYEDLTVRQNLAYFRAVLRARPSDVDRVLSATGMSAEADRTVGSLSGGQQGRVSLAVALLGDPELLVLDEPTVGLDPVLRAELWGLFRSLARAGVTLLISSHVMDEATRCDRLLLMRDGRILADDTPSGLLAATGTADADAAFLALVAGGERHEELRP